MEGLKERSITMKVPIKWGRWWFIRQVSTNHQFWQRKKCSLKGIQVQTTMLII